MNAALIKHSDPFISPDPSGARVGAPANDNWRPLAANDNADNNPTNITDNVTAGNTQTLTYDPIDRLKSAIGTYGTVSSITYDSNSNRKTYGAISYTTPGANDRMSTANGSSITYISTGNVNGIGTNTMTYNQANQLKTAVVSGTTSTYTYDFLGVRNKIKTGTSPFEITQYDQWGNLLTETSQAATPVETDYAYLDGMPISAIQPTAATISALHTDNLGTVLRGSDSTKAIVYTANFNPNGSVTPTTTITQNLRYRGQHVDSTGLYYNGFRYLDPVTLTRYGQVDPLGIWVGPTTFNPYPYAGYNALKNIDPWGLNTQIGITYGGTVGIGIAGTGTSTSLGISVPDNLWQISGYQIFGSTQLNGMAGLGLFGGGGLVPFYSTTDGPLPAGFSGEIQNYAEGDIGGDEAVSVSVQGNPPQYCTAQDPQGVGNYGYSLGVPIKALPGVGIGIWGGIGKTGVGTFATPTF